MSSTDVPTNRLALETSPYLLQHRHNPVDWYPWGPEALHRARTENKPIFLSVGYSTCYWCHVMERQCFENPVVADEMNRRYVCIKVDREERPDLDQLYMTAVQLLTRHGGWPMSVFLLPDLRPYFGGTYFPPDDAPGRPGFLTLLRVLDDATRTRTQDVHTSAAQINDALAELGQPRPPTRAVTIDEAFLSRVVQRSTSDFDSRHGGFGQSPKFPRQTLLELLLMRQRSTPDPAVMHQVTQSLDAMAHGGIRDQLGGGFHRYSTDAQWLVPHFEIMLYDNAMLGWCYAEAFAQTGDARYQAVARGVFDFVLRDLTDPAGGFYTALDAEVDAREGMPYLWTRTEVEQALADALGDAPDAEARIAKVCRIYGLDTGPNFADPHHGTGEPDHNVLFVAEPDTSPSPLLGHALVPLRDALLKVRNARKQPLLDTKIITSWNALMIRALAHGGKVLGEPRYTVAAEKAATFLLQTHRTANGPLRRTSRDGVVKHSAFLDDYAFLAQALLELATVTGNTTWTAEARSVFTTMTDTFADAAGGFYFTEAGAPDLIVRQKVSSDSPLPSGNGVAAQVSLALGAPDVCRHTIEMFTGHLLANAESMSALVQAADMYVRSHGAIHVTPPPAASAPATPAAVTLVGKWFTPQRLRVGVTIADGLHLNGPAPTAGLTPTTLSVTGAAPNDIIFPAAQPLRLPSADLPVTGYTGHVLIEVFFANAVTAPLTVTLRYQACSDTACLAPASVSLEVAP